MSTDQPRFSSSQQSPIWRLLPRPDGSSSKAAMIIGKKGVVRYRSKAVLKLLGYEAGELEGRPFWDLLSGESKETAREAFRQMREDGRRLAEWTFCFRLPSGKQRWLAGKVVNFLKDPRLGGILAYWERVGSAQGKPTANRS